jgi:hypothetical protein
MVTASRSRFNTRRLLIALAVICVIYFGFIFSKNRRENPPHSKIKDRYEPIKQTLDTLPTSKKIVVEAQKKYPLVWDVSKFTMDLYIVKYQVPNLNCPKQPVALSDIMLHLKRDDIQNRFAIVMPFIGAQLDKLLSNLQRWSTPEYYPGDQNKIPADLFFYFHRGKDEAMEKKITDTIERNNLGNYFQSIQFLYADLSDPDDEYPTGASRMFYLLYDREQIRKNYGYFFYMEPDSVPIRPGWLDYLKTISFGNTRPFWVMGSIFRGSSEPLPKDKIHINGNAIYTTAEDYHLFLCRLLEKHFYVYDVDPFYYFFKNYEDQKALWHNWIFSDYIINISKNPYSESKMKQENPYTYFLHAGGANEDVKSI